MNMGIFAVRLVYSLITNTIYMKQRLFYEAPEAELFVVRFEENFLVSPQNTTSSELRGRTIGSAGAAGGDDLDGGTAYL